MKRIALVLAATIAAAIVLGWLTSRGFFGQLHDGGQITTEPRDAERVDERLERQVSSGLRGPGEKQILFGDLHAHTTFSFDAFNMSLPSFQGEGAHPPADACDFARFCSGLDFWSINDHAEGLTSRQWNETKRMVRACNDVAGNPADPDLVTFLGWEWTQIGATPETHYGHKNIVLLDTEEDRVPVRPIASRDRLFPGQANPYNAMMRLLMIARGGGDRGRGPYHDFARFLQERVDAPICDRGSPRSTWPLDCRESAETPRQLFTLLDQFERPYMVIPHGNTWGFYTPPLTTWDKQLADHTEPERHEPLIEIFSGHGNIEQLRSWRALDRDEDGRLRCPGPSRGYTPECWRAGEIVEGRCLETGESASECAARAAAARGHHVAAGDAGHLTVPAQKSRTGSTRASAPTATCRPTTIGPGARSSTPSRSRASTHPVHRSASASG